MTSLGRAEAVAQELALSDEELKGAELMIAGGVPRIGVTRAYFASFYAARALLYSIDIKPTSHAGVLRLLQLHFVKAGRLALQFEHTLRRLQKFRGEADYGDSFAIDAASARNELEETLAFCAAVRALLP